jgi:hypothetical protein
MLPGISSSGGYFPPSFVTSVRTAPAHTAAAPAPEVKSEPQPADLRAPEGTTDSLSREFNLFDLANRQYAEILPRIETATVPVQ